MPPFENPSVATTDTLFGLFGTLTLNPNNDRNEDDNTSVIANEPIPVALKNVSIQAQTVDFIAEVIVEQTYKNESEHTLEAVYKFPVDESASICGLTATMDDGSTVNAVCQQKDQARQTYTAAKREGYQATLLESTHQQRDVLTLSVGNLPPNQGMKIRLTYVTTLQSQEGDDEDDRNRAPMALVLPTYLAPRYTPPSTALSALCISSGMTNHIPSTVSVPKATATTTTTTTPEGGYKLQVTVNVQCHSPITKIVPAYHDSTLLTNDWNTCVIHNDSLADETNDNDNVQNEEITKKHTATITLLDVTMDRDLVLLIHEKNPYQPRVCLELTPRALPSALKGNNENDKHQQTVQEEQSLAGFVTLRPDLLFGDKVHREFIFLVDRSGSMGQRHCGRRTPNGASKTQIQQAGEALGLFLRALPPTCTFNIVGFGGTYRSLFDTPQPYNDQNLAIASQYAATMRADMGGTNLNPALENVLGMTKSTLDCDADTKQTAQCHQRQVFVLTDGQVSNSNQVFHTISKFCNSKNCRVFSLGVGSSVSRHLVKGMAKAGKGTAKFVDGRDDTAIRTTVLSQLKQSLQPALDDVTIEWSFSQESSKTVEDPATPATTDATPETMSIVEPPKVKSLLGYRSPSADSPLPQPTATTTRTVKCYPQIAQPIFSGERFLSFAMFGDASRLPTSVTVKCSSPDGPLEVTMDINPDEDVYEGRFAHRLAAKTAIHEFEDSNTYTGHATNTFMSSEEALQLALQYNLLSQQTSFVAVSEKPVVTPGTISEKQIIPQIIPQMEEASQASPLYKYKMRGPQRSRGSNLPTEIAQSAMHSGSGGGRFLERRRSPSPVFRSPMMVGSCGSAPIPSAGDFLGGPLPPVFRSPMMVGSCGSSPIHSTGGFLGSANSSSSIQSSAMYSGSGGDGFHASSSDVSLQKKYGGAVEHRGSPPPTVADPMIVRSCQYGSASMPPPPGGFLEPAYSPSSSPSSEEKKRMKMCKRMCKTSKREALEKRERSYHSSRRGGVGRKTMQAVGQLRQTFSMNTSKSNSIEEKEPTFQSVVMKNRDDSTDRSTGGQYSVQSSKEIKAVSEDDFLLQLCLQQRADGSFPANSCVADLVGKSLQVLEQQATANGVDAVVWTTIIVMVTMKRRFSAQKAVWELQMKKATDYLRAIVGSQTMKDLMEKGTETL